MLPLGKVGQSGVRSWESAAEVAGMAAVPQCGQRRACGAWGVLSGPLVQGPGKPKEGLSPHLALRQVPSPENSVGSL